MRQTLLFFLHFQLQCAIIVLSLKVECQFFVNKATLHRAIALLSRREQSLKELEYKLQRAGFAADDISPVLTFLVQENYQSDIRAAESLFRNRVSRGYGLLYIQQELQQKGINSQIITAVAQEQAVDWYLQIAQTYQKKFGDSLVNDQKEKAKRMRFLQYRGFSFDEISSVLQTDY